MTDLIILRSVFGKTGMICFVNPVVDPKTRAYPPHVKQVDSKGDMILTDKEKNDGNIYIPVTEVFRIEDGTTFDLVDPRQKAEWEAIQFCPAIALSRDQRDAKGNLVIDGDTKRYGIAELYIERPGYVTNKKVSKKKLVHQAETYIWEDPRGTDGRIFMAKLFGRNVKGLPDADITDYLLEIAEKDPERVINLYCSDDLTFRLLFVDAREKHVIYVKNKIYMFGDGEVILGATDDAVIEWMKRPSSAKALELIRRATYPELYQENQSDSQDTPTAKVSKK